MLAGLLAIASGIYVAQNFKIDTDINKLISPDLPWRKQELVVSRAFPQHAITAVIDAHFGTCGKRKFGTNARISKA